MNINLLQVKLYRFCTACFITCQVLLVLPDILVSIIINAVSVNIKSAEAIPGTGTLQPKNRNGLFPE